MRQRGRGCSLPRTDGEGRSVEGNSPGCQGEEMRRRAEAAEKRAEELEGAVRQLRSSANQALGEAGLRERSLRGELAGAREAAEAAASQAADAEVRQQDFLPACLSLFPPPFRPALACHLPFSTPWLPPPLHAPCFSFLTLCAPIPHRLDMCRPSSLAILP